MSDPGIRNYIQGLIKQFTSCTGNAFLQKKHHRYQLIGHQGLSFRRHQYAYTLRQTARREEASKTEVLNNCLGKSPPWSISQKRAVQKVGHLHIWKAANYYNSYSTLQILCTTAPKELTVNTYSHSKPLAIWGNPQISSRLGHGTNTIKVQLRFSAWGSVKCKQSLQSFVRKNISISEKCPWTSAVPSQHTTSHLPF